MSTPQGAEGPPLQQAGVHCLQVCNAGRHGRLPAAAAVPGVIVAHHVTPQLLRQFPADGTRRGGCSERSLARFRARALHRRHVTLAKPAAATDWSATDQRATPSDSAAFLCQLIQVTLCHGCLAHQARNAAAGLPVKGQHLAEVHSVAMAEQDCAWRLPPRGRERNVRCNDLLPWRALPAAAGGYAQHRAAEHFAAAPAATVHSG